LQNVSFASGSDDKRVILEWHDEAFADYLHWQKHNKETARRIDRLLADIKQHPFEGIGKPEPLKHDLQGYWSRHITEKERILYEVVGDIVYVHRCRGHYE
jgi:toxin YoeB